MLLCLNLSQTEIIFKESLEGWVESGNYTYFSYNGNYKINLILRSLSGDADLYVSQSDSNGRTVKPKFDLNAHDIQSVTCGQDFIHIPEEFERPIGIGVYGHPSHDSSHFTLDVIAFEETEDSSSYISEEELEFYEEFFGEPYTGLNKVSKSKQNSINSDNNHKHNDKSSHSNEKHSENWNFVLDLLANIIHILLEAIL